MFRSIILLLILCSCQVNAGQAQEHSVKKDSIKLLSPVEVIGKQQHPSITPVQKIDRESIERLSNNSVADAIRYFSGVQLKDYGGIGGLKTVNIRSMGSEQVGVFYDGMPLGNAQNGQIDLGRFSLDNMAAINLYNGQKADLLQSAKEYGSASAIYLKTIRPTLTAENRRLVKLNFKTGSFGLINPSVLWQERLNENIQTSLSAAVTKAHGRYPFTIKKLQEGGNLAYDTTAIRKNGDIKGLRIEPAIYGQIPDGTWDIQTYFYFSERGLPGYIASNVYEHKQRQWDENIFVQGSINKSISPIYSILIKAKIAKDYLRYLDKGQTAIPLDNRFTQHDKYMSVANEWKITKYWNWGLATDYQRTNLNADYILTQNNLRVSRDAALAALATSYRLPNFQLSSSLLANYITDITRSKNIKKHHRNFSPNLALSTKPFSNKDITLGAFYKKSFRTPTFNELYYTLLGIALLEPEIATQHNINIQYIGKFPSNYLKQLTISSNAYYNQVKHKIVALPTNSEFRWTLLNLGKVSIKGLEINTASDWQIKENLIINASINYTYQKAIDVTSPSDSYYKHQIPYTPWHSGTAVLQAEFKKWLLTYSYVYTGERYDNQNNIARTYIRPWYTSDIAFATKLNIKKLQYKFGVEVNNIFSQYFDIVLNYPMPGRNFKINCAITL